MSERTTWTGPLAGPDGIEGTVWELRRPPDGPWPIDARGCQTWVAEGVGCMVRLTLYDGHLVAVARVPDGTLRRYLAAHAWDERLEGWTVSGRTGQWSARASQRSRDDVAERLLWTVERAVRDVWARVEVWEVSGGF